MLKKYTYFLVVNGLYFGFDSAKRIRKDSSDRLRFYSHGKCVCHLDLLESCLIFNFFIDDVIHFTIAPVGGGADNGK